MFKAVLCASVFALASQNAIADVNSNSGMKLSFAIETQFGAAKAPHLEMSFGAAPILRSPNNLDYSLHTGIAYSSIHGFAPKLFGMPQHTVNLVLSNSESEKPWYKNGWAIAGGVLAVGAAVALSSRGSSSEIRSDDESNEGGTVCGDDDVVLGNECVP